MTTNTDEFLGEELDKNGRKISIYVVAHVNMTSTLVAFFIRQWAELLELGYATRNYIPNIEGSRAIFAVCDGEIIGLRMWRWGTNLTSSRIILTSVDKRYRRMGILTMLNKYYEDRIRATCKNSYTFIDKNNLPMIEAAKKTGYTIDQLKMVKRYK